MTTQQQTTEPTTISAERADLLDTLARHRGFLRHTLRDLTDEQARLRPAASELSLGGLIKHVGATEASWVDFMLERPPAAPDYAAWLNNFTMGSDETLSEVLEHYEALARQTDQALIDVPDLDTKLPLPDEPWFEPGAAWSVRRVALHLIAEISQHAGHADILRESIDGAKTMG